MFDYFLHNGMANILVTNILVKSISYIISAWMLLSLIVMKLPEQRYKWILLIIPLAAISHPMIEPRYYFPAYFIIHLLRPALPIAVETGTLVCYVLVAAYILYGSVSGMFFL
jgi:alpha-1,2-glucosyltransferase